MIKWEIHGQELANCNCNFGCPCQYNAPPTDGTCEAAVGFQIDKGFYGDVNLVGLKCAGVYKWPGPVHEGDGQMQLIIDESASAAQRDALQKIMMGEDTDDMATMWWVYSAMSPNRLDTLFKRISISIDVESRSGHVSVQDVFETTAEPIKNPVTGAEHRARIDIPHGFEYRVAEVGSGTTKTSGAMNLQKNNDSHAHFAELHLSGSGLISPASVV